MDLLVNDLSLHGQFHDDAGLHEAIFTVMSCREVARRHGRALYCHRGLASVEVMPGRVMQQALATMDRSVQRAVLGWLSQHGPFWDDVRVHEPGDYYEFDGDVVTESALAEAAHHTLHGIDFGLVSFRPSRFEFSPVIVDRVGADEHRQRAVVPNFWDQYKLAEALQHAPTPLTSWGSLAETCVTRFDSLTFCEGAFEPLRDQPFKQGAALRITVLLDVLHRLRGCVGPDGELNKAGKGIYQQHFVGEKAWFTDSSDSEKQSFAHEMTFRHPELPGETIPCTWHGKVKTPQYRIHFSWPITADRLYIAYVGPKLTKR